jgi:hypothetical protein
MTINDRFEPGPNDDRRFIPRYKRECLPDQINAEEFHRLLMAGRIVDGRCGGIILGKMAENGGPRGIFKIGSDYLIQGQFNGGDFVVNKEAAVPNMGRLNAMNQGRTRKEVITEAGPDEFGMLIVTTANPDDRLLWLDFGQIVVNRDPAQKHLAELLRLNQSVNPYLTLNLHQVFGCDPGTTDGIV